MWNSKFWPAPWTLILVSSWFVSADCEAGAWTQAQYHYYLRFTAGRFLASSFFDENGRRQDYGDSGKYTDVGLYAYLEYGLSDWLTLVSTIPYNNLDYESSTLERKTSGAGDLYLGMRYLLSDRNVVSSVQAGFNLSTGYETDAERLDLAPPLGDGQTDFELRLQFGQSILGYAAYYNFDFGYRTRSGFPVDELPVAVELGLHLGSVGLIIGKMYGVKALAEAESAIARPPSQVTLSPVEDFLKAQWQLIVGVVKQIELAIVYESVIDGRNTAAGRSIALALTLQGSAK